MFASPVIDRKQFKEYQFYVTSICYAVKGAHMSWAALFRGSACDAAQEIPQLILFGR
jgi:hypothetical protein